VLANMLNFQWQMNSSLKISDTHLAVVGPCDGIKAHAAKNLIRSQPFSLARRERSDECLWRLTYEDTKATWTVFRRNPPTLHSGGDGHLALVGPL
jgi:hypothetical protein